MGERGKYALFLLFFTTRSEKGHKRRSCEEMNPHFFTAPFILHRCAATSALRKHLIQPMRIEEEVKDAHNEDPVITAARAHDILDEDDLLEPI